MLFLRWLSTSFWPLFPQPDAAEARVRTSAVAAAVRIGGILFAVPVFGQIISAAPAS